MTNLTMDDFEDMFKKAESFSTFSRPVDFVQSRFAVTLEGKKPLVMERTLRRRFFSWPWKPWVKTFTIQVPNYVPAAYRIGNKIIYHPALEAQIRAMKFNFIPGLEERRSLPFVPPL